MLRKLKLSQLFAHVWKYVTLATNFMKPMLTEPAAMFITLPGLLNQCLKTVCMWNIHDPVYCKGMDYISLIHILNLPILNFFETLTLAIYVVLVWPRAYENHLWLVVWKMMSSSRNIPAKLGAPREENVFFMMRAKKNKLESTSRSYISNKNSEQCRDCEDSKTSCRKKRTKL